MARRRLVFRVEVPLGVPLPQREVQTPPPGSMSTIGPMHARQRLFFAPVRPTPGVLPALEGPHHIPALRREVRTPPPEAQRAPFDENPR